MTSTWANEADQIDPSKLRLILSAEQLFAHRGIDGVSLREIAAAAGQGNNSAVRYHFGSKEGLILAVTEYRVAQLDVPRQLMLAAAERAGRLQDIVTLFEILCLPQVDLVDETGKHPYAHFMTEFLTRYRPRGVAHSSDIVSDSSIGLRRLVGLIRRQMGHVPKQFVTDRIELCHLMFHNVLVRCDYAGLFARNPAAFHSVVHDTIELAAAAAIRPYRKDNERDYSVQAWLKNVGEPRK